ncbi:hypothetical protein ACF1AJ_20635 [Leifsonia sp. NPDC014704]
MNRKPYSIHRRRDWVPVTVALLGLTAAACAVAVWLYAIAGVSIR